LKPCGDKGCVRGRL
ncbi:unnamed protein product, partial [Caretta caretta]